MPVLAIEPLLAADPGTIIGLVVGALTLLGWILNYANQKQAQQQPPARPNRPIRPQRAEDRLQSEIDVFLEEVRGGRRKLAEEPARPAVEPPRRPARPVRQRPVQQRPVQRPAEQPVRRPLQSAEPRPLEAHVPQPVEPRLAQRQRPAGDRTRIRRRVADHVSSDRLEAHASQLGRGVEAAVQSHLGLFTAADAPAAAVAAPVPVATADTAATGDLAQQVRALLAQPAGVRQAVLISEILSRPRTMRGRT